MKLLLFCFLLQSLVSGTNTEKALDNGIHFVYLTEADYSCQSNPVLTLLSVNSNLNFTANELVKEVFLNLYCEIKVYGSFFETFVQENPVPVAAMLL